MTVRSATFLVLLFGAFALPAVEAAETPQTMALSAAVRDALDDRLDQVVATSILDSEGVEYRNVVVRLEAPRLGLNYRGAAGIGEIDPPKPMSGEHQFYIESITKTFTATVAMQLAEEGLLGETGIEATLAELELFPPEVLDRLHLIDGVSSGAGITVSQLLHHRTGMKNFTYDDEGGRAGDYPDSPFAPGSFLGVFLGDPERGLMRMLRDVGERLPEGADAGAHFASHGLPEGLSPETYWFYSSPFSHWDYEAWRKDPADRMAGLLNFYLSAMNETARFPPGEAFAYTDTNYLILGLLIEKVTGNSLHAEMRRRIFDPLEMADTYLSYATDPPADRYRRNLSELWAVGLPIVERGLNRSMMWSDAGIVSTVDDLSVFIRALANGRLFQKESTWQEMIAVPDEEPMAYGCGIGVARRGDQTILFHSGGAASWMFYYVEEGISFVGTMNDATASGRERLVGLHRGVLEALADHGIQLESPF